MVSFARARPSIARLYAPGDRLLFSVGMFLSRPPRTCRHAELDPLVWVRTSVSIARLYVPACVDNLVIQYVFSLPVNVFPLPLMRLSDPCDTSLRSRFLSYPIGVLKTLIFF